MKSFKVASLVFVVGLAACGGSSQTTPPQSSGAPGVTQASQIVQKLLTRPTDLGLASAGVTGTIPAGKRIAYMQCGVSSCVPPGDYLTEAAAKLGWTLQRIDDGLTPEAVKAGWDQAVREANAGQLDAVIGVGFANVLFKSELAALAAKGVPVINQSVTEPSGNGEIVVNGAQRVNLVGKYMADFVIADSGGSANTVLVITSAFPIQVGVETGFKAEYQRLCPSCGLDRLEAPVESIGTTLSTNVVGYLRSHPKVTYVAYGLDNAVEGLPAALQSAGLAGKVKIVGEAPSGATMHYIAAGAQAATIGFPWPEVAWRSILVLAHIFSGDAITSPAVSAAADDTNWPWWILTKQNATPETLSGYFPLVQNYQQQFLSLWPHRQGA